MNFVAVCAQLVDNPREVYTSATSTALRCTLGLPPIGNKAPTHIDLNVYGKSIERFGRLAKGNHIYLHGSKLRYDLDSRQFSLHGGVFSPVDAEQFPILNTIILSGRCVKNVDHDDARAFKTTADGLMICNQTLTVNTGRNQSDLFNFYAINNAEDKPNNAQLLADFTRKGTGLTIQGRFVTDTWVDKSTQERRVQTKIQVVTMTLGPKPQDGPKQIQSQTTVSSGDNVTSLWGGRTADEQPDPWGQGGSGLPDLPGQYGSAPDTTDDDNAPF